MEVVPGHCSSFDCTCRICEAEPGRAGLSGESGADSEDAAIGTSGEAGAARAAALTSGAGENMTFVGKTCKKIENGNL